VPCSRAARWGKGLPPVAWLRWGSGGAPGWPQAWLAPHPGGVHGGEVARTALPQRCALAARAAAGLRMPPSVHSGFLKSWTANGLHERVVERVRTICTGPDVHKGSIKVLITGTPGGCTAPRGVGGALGVWETLDCRRNELQEAPEST
jgi:hypothetical protein